MHKMHPVISPDKSSLHDSLCHTMNIATICALSKCELAATRPESAQIVNVRYVQGFGNVGAWAAEILHEQGGRVIAVSDAFGGIYNDKGLDITALRKHVATGGKLQEFPECKPAAELGVQNSTSCKSW